MKPFKYGFIQKCVSYGLDKSAAKKLFKQASTLTDVLIPAGIGLGSGAVNYLQNQDVLRAGLSGLGAGVGTAAGASLGGMGGQYIGQEITRSNLSPRELHKPALSAQLDPNSQAYVTPPDIQTQAGLDYQYLTERALKEHGSKLKQYLADIAFNKDINAQVAAAGAEGGPGSNIGTTAGGGLGGLGGYYLGDWLAQQVAGKKDKSVKEK